jgi:hypothetical protein
MDSLADRSRSYWAAHAGSYLVFRGDLPIQKWNLGAWVSQRIYCLHKVFHPGNLGPDFWLGLG